MIAIRAPQCLDLVTAAVLTTGLLLMEPATPSSAPAVDTMSAAEHLDARWTDRPWRRHENVCDPSTIKGVVVRGQFTSLEPQSFAISFGSVGGHYTAITDQRGYFEIRIPREHFDGNVCELPNSYRNFRDAQMTLEYRVEAER